MTDATASASTGAAAAAAADDATAADTQTDIQPNHAITQFIVANNPLPENEFPQNAPPLEDMHLNLASRPRLLRSVEELAELMAESRNKVGFSNFAEASLPTNSARTPVYPTFTRFSSTRFAGAELGEHTVIPSEHSHRGALFDLKYPIILSVTDGHQITIPGVPNEGVVDSQGYPLLYDAEMERKTIRVRPAGAMFPSNLSMALVNRLTPMPDATLTRTWTHMFLLSNDRDAQNILLQRVFGHGAGDCHIALLVKAYLAYLDSIAGALEGVVPARHTVSADDVVVNVASNDGWTNQMLGSNAEIVNVIGGTPGYQEFWAYCCFPRPPIYAAKTAANNKRSVSLFSHYEMGTGISMKCLCDFDAFQPRQTPEFFGKPNLILGYIEMYVQRYALQLQANEALQIAMLWPVLCQTGAHVSLPRPCHLMDWFGSEVQASTVQTGYTGLISSNPFVVLASTLAGAWAMRSQIFDYVALLTSRRDTWKLTADTVKFSAAWLMTRASAPGVGWDFLLRHQFHITPSFLYLTGLSVQVVDWSALLTPFTWLDAEFPAHLRLLQPFWTKMSVACMLPWYEVWKPQFEVSGHILQASPTTIQCMLRLGLLSQGRANPAGLVRTDAIYPLLDNDAVVTLGFETYIPEQLSAVKNGGLRVLALCAHPHRVEVTRVLSSRDPADSRQVQEAWAMGGLLQNIAVEERGGDAMHARESPYPHPGLANSYAVSSASARLQEVKERLSELAIRTADAAGQSLIRESGKRYVISDTTTVPDHSLVYSPQTNGDCGWWCVLYLVRLTSQDQRSMACLRRTVARVAGPASMSVGTLSMMEMAGVCSILKVNLPRIYSKKQTMTLDERWLGDDNKVPTLMLRLSDDHWTVVSTGSGITTEVEMCHMPVHREGPIQLESDTPVQIAEISTVEEATPNLPTKARLMDEAIREWDIGVRTTENTIRLHCALFPGIMIPRFLAAGASATMSADRVDAIKNDETNGRIIMQFLRKQCGHTFDEFLGKHMGSQVTDTTRWPFREPGNAMKNNLSVIELLSALDPSVPQEALALWFIWTHQGNHSEFVTSVAVWLAGIDLCDCAWMELFATKLLDQNEDTWLAATQKVHDAWRKTGLTHCQCNSCWTQLLYIQSLWGRGGIEVDWEKEISNKARVPDDILAYTGSEWSAEFATKLIRDTVRDVLKTAMPRLRIQKFDDFIDNAYEWLVSGSAAGMPSAFKDTDVRKILLERYNLKPRPTKRSVMENIPRGHILQQLQSRPQIVAKVHQKLNETGGKARAIYGVTVWHYVFSNWLMAPFEKAIDHPNIDVNITTDKFLKCQVRRAQAARQGAYFSSYDYPDFNSMHTHYHMSIIYEEAAAIARAASVNMDPADVDLIMQGYRWLEEATFTQVCFLPGPDALIQTVGGLYSGNRDTMMINTILNIAYSEIVDTSCRNMGLDPQVVWRLCHGDDIITQHGSYGTALAWNAVASKAKLKGQDNKLLTDRSFHEYLRIMGCPDGTLRGSLARVVATFVNGNWETDYTAGAHAKVIELQATLGVLQRRGMRSVFREKLWVASITRVAAKISGDDADAETLRSALKALLPVGKDLRSDAKTSLAHTSSTDADQTGLQGPQPKLYAEVMRRERLEIEKLFQDLPDEVTRPYVQRLIQTLPPELRYEPGLGARLKLMLQKSTYGSEMPSRFQIETKQTPQLLSFRSKVVAAEAKSGKNVRVILLQNVSRIIGDHKLFATTIRRIKALHILLLETQHMVGYSKTELIAHLCKLPEADVRHVLLTERLLETDWRRLTRPSAAEVAALENELELYLTGDGTLHEDEEVVLYTDDGNHRQVPVRTLLLY